MTAITPTVRGLAALTTFAAYTRARGARRTPDSARAVEMASEAAGSPEKTAGGSEVIQEPIPPVVPAKTITIVDG